MPLFRGCRYRMLWIEGSSAISLCASPAENADAYVGIKGRSAYVAIVVPGTELKGEDGGTFIVAVGVKALGNHRLGLTIDPRDLLTDTAVSNLASAADSTGVAVVITGSPTEAAPLPVTPLREVVERVLETKVKMLAHIDEVHVGVVVKPGRIFETLANMIASYVTSTATAILPALQQIIAMGRVARSGETPAWAKVLLALMVLGMVVVMILSVLHR